MWIESEGGQLYNLNHAVCLKLRRDGDEFFVQAVMSFEATVDGLDGPEKVQETVALTSPGTREDAQAVLDALKKRLSAIDVTPLKSRTLGGAVTGPVKPSSYGGTY